MSRYACFVLGFALGSGLISACWVWGLWSADRAKDGAE